MAQRLDSARIKGPWSPEEDDLLQKLVEKHGPRNWSLISKSVPGRSRKSCRLRWCNQLSPQVEHQAFTLEEDETIVRAHAKFGNKWATIARLLSGRTRSDQSTVPMMMFDDMGFDADYDLFSSLPIKEPDTCPSDTKPETYDDSSDDEEIDISELEKHMWRRGVNGGGRFCNGVV